MATRSRALSQKPTTKSYHVTHPAKPSPSNAVNSMPNWSSSGTMTSKTTIQKVAAVQVRHPAISPAYPKDFSAVIAPKPNDSGPSAHSSTNQTKNERRLSVDPSGRPRFSGSQPQSNGYKKPGQSGKPLSDVHSTPSPSLQSSIKEDRGRVQSRGGSRVIESGGRHTQAGDENVQPGTQKPIGNPGKGSTADIQDAKVKASQELKKEEKPPSLDYRSLITNARYPVKVNESLSTPKSDIQLSKVIDYKTPADVQLPAPHSDPVKLTSAQSRDSPGSLVSAASDLSTSHTLTKQDNSTTDLLRQNGSSSSLSKQATVRPPSAPKKDSVDSIASQSTTDTVHHLPSSKRLDFSTAGHSSLSQFTDTDSVRVVGLRNFGNICFMNSIIQCLCFTPGFEAHLTQAKNAKAELNPEAKTHGELFAAVIEVLKEMKCTSKSSVSVINVQNAIGQVDPRFTPYDQHDAHEFLRFLLDALHEDLNRTRAKQPSTKLARTIAEGRKLEHLAEDWWRDSISRGSSRITDMFQGQLLNILTCTVCQNHSYTFDVFLDLSVPIPPSDAGRMSLSGTTLLRCFDEFSAEKELEGVKCKHCKAPRLFKTRMMIWRFPKILVIHLKRFAVTLYSEVKINTAVTCPMTKLDLRNYAQSSRHESAERPFYDLYGIVHHFGNVDYGHYYA